MKIILNPDYTFENYLITNGNRPVREAIHSIITRPGHIHNPLFIYGRAGVGKTHLLQAVAHEMTKQGTRLNTRYATSEEFVNDVIQAMQGRSYKDFVSSCMSLDILLIDDIHLLKDKKHTLKELFYIFKRLYDTRKQIIVSGNRPLKRIFKSGSNIFERGLIVEMHSPAHKDRLKFLQGKAEKAGLSLNDDIFEKIAGKAGLMGFRELEGALARTKLYASYALISSK